MEFKDFIARINRIRKQNPALQSDPICAFTISIILADLYSKATTIFRHYHLALSRSFHAKQLGNLDLNSLGLDPAHAFQVHDLLGEGRICAGSAELCGTDT